MMSMAVQYLYEQCVKGAVAIFFIFFIFHPIFLKFHTIELRRNFCYKFYFFSCFSLKKNTFFATLLKRIEVGELS